LARNALEFNLRGISHTSQGYLTYRKVLQHGADGFIYPSKEGVLRVFIAFKDASPSAGHFAQGNIFYY
jgi:hypothetical protein